MFLKNLKLSDLEGLKSRNFQVEFSSHARAILNIDFPEILGEIEEVMLGLTIPVEELVKGGGGEAKLTQSLRRQFAAKGWNKHNFKIEKLVDGVPKEAVSHEVDQVKNSENGKVALELEWNNKDPFYDRDLENFKRLHADGVISAGIIITRGRSLQDGLKDAILKFANSKSIKSYEDLKGYGINPTGRQTQIVNERLKDGSRTFAEAWSSAFCADKYGQATTHWRKLEDRVHRGVGNPCPLLLIGIPINVIEFS